ncbi:ComEA family DNA-binding protein [Portibacter lacus]|uniref:Helix-hairpin-helix domain-containing protein n=1 Tax=Portibacter lacus TaxID=1099794 RepID=A0AA37WH00_9BACT|nr:helix-hairpin-helix domain-containing protein [Portibacter lacus]GLR18345.1 hypothetical protein GCM10007940_29610 [Portibacter lacus]
MFRIILSLSLFLFVANVTYSQSLEAEEWVESILANQDEDAELDLNTILEQINEYIERPFDLNKISRQELSDLFFLSDLEISAIINHRSQHGDFINILELQSVEGLPLEKVRLLADLARVRDLAKPQIDQGILRDQKHEVYIKWRRVLEKQKGYTDDVNSPYLGDPNKLYVRYKYVAGKKLQLGLTAEKDAGEEFFTGSNKNGFDYYSGHLAINNPTSFIKQAIIGDYSISLGQGLIAAMGFGTGKSTQVMRVKNRTRPLRPYTSVNEFNFLRGGALDLNLSKNLNLLLYGSYQLRDANFFLDTVNNDIFTLYTSIPSDGFHRNVNEIRKEKQLGFTDAGTSLRFRRKSLSVNANLMYSAFGSSLNTSPDLYQLFSVLQQKYINGSVDYGYIWNNFNFFGEMSSDKEGDLGFVNGVILGLDKNFEVAVVYRNIAKNYQSIYANTFTESSNAQNEEGIYASALLRLNKQFHIEGYADFFRHPWLKFRVDSPSNGQEFYLKFLYHKKRKADFYIQYFYETKEQNASESLKTTNVAQLNRQRLRFHNAYKINPTFEIRNRVEFSLFTKDDQVSRGFMIYQDIIFKPKKLPLSATMRYAIFDTDDYDSRIYTYENDLLYEFSIPAFANRGFRTYANLRYRVNRFLTAEFRVSRTYLNNQSTIGSALEEINGNRRTDLKAQLRFKF